MSQAALSPLGKNTTYSYIYNPQLLYSIDRILRNNKNSMFGYDLWHLYELSWLNSNGIPQVAIGNILYNRDSPRLIESKSLKLYLNSFNNSKFISAQSVVDIIRDDLSQILHTQVWVEIFNVNSQSKIITPHGISIDNLEIKVEQFDFETRHQYLSQAIVGDSIVSETLHSNLLRSNCPITNQPDWGTIIIEYTGYPISHEQLLRYILSYRMHNDFHEHCVDNIYLELMEHCNPKQLKVYAQYTRRGGIDINPYRSSQIDFNPEIVISSIDRLIRQ
jgi:7-cyano-7-deazaguanine reductase